MAAQVTARVRFIAEGETCEVFGRVFHRHRWTSAEGLAEDQLARLAANPTFEVDMGEAVAPAAEPE